MAQTPTWTRVREVLLPSLHRHTLWTLLLSLHHLPLPFFKDLNHLSSCSLSEVGRKLCQLKSAVTSLSHEGPYILHYHSWRQFIRVWQYKTAYLNWGWILLTHIFHRIQNFMHASKIFISIMLHQGTKIRSTYWFLMLNFYETHDKKATKPLVFPVNGTVSVPMAQFLVKQLKQAHWHKFASLLWISSSVWVIGAVRVIRHT